MNIITQLCEALAYTLAHSLWQAFVLFLIYLAASQFIKQSIYRYQLLVFLMVVAFGWAAYTFYINFETISLNAAVQKVVLGKNVPINFAILEQFSANMSLSFKDYLQVFLAKYSFYISSLWLFGLVFYLLKLWSEWLFVNNLKNQNLKHNYSQEMEALIKKMALAFQLSSKIKLVFHSQHISPMVIGVFKPMVFFPISLASHLSMTEIEAILAHELAHIKHNHYLWNYVVVGIRYLFYFNPSIVLLHKELQAQRELVADQLAKQYMGGGKVLASSLVKCESLLQNQQLALGFSQKGNLQNRVFSLLNLKKSRTNMKTIMLIVLMLGGAGFWTYFQLNASQNINSKSKSIIKADTATIDKIENTTNNSNSIDNSSSLVFSINNNNKKNFQIVFTDKETKAEFDLVKGICKINNKNIKMLDEDKLKMENILLEEIENSKELIKYPYSSIFIESNNSYYFAFLRNFSKELDSLHHDIILEIDKKPENKDLIYQKIKRIESISQSKFINFSIEKFKNLEISNKSIINKALELLPEEFKKILASRATPPPPPPPVPTAKDLPIPPPPPVPPTPKKD